MVLNTTALKMAYRLRQDIDITYDWFQDETREYFQTKVLDISYQVGGDILFITSDTDEDGYVGYTLREMGTDGLIESLGAFFLFPTYEKIREVFDALCM